jgi:hypothetical protein|nr:hypothetical protein [Neorhizobium tomejilense]
MKIAFPYIYSAEVVVGKKRNPQPLFYVDTVATDMAEVTSAQAPVVISWQGQLNADRDRHARYFEGNFYIPASALYRDAAHFTANDIAVADRLSKSEQADALSAMNDYRVGTDEWHAFLKAVTGRMSDRNQPSDIRELVKSDQDIRRAKAEDIANSLISVDGIVYRRIAEPVFVVSVIEAAAPNVRVGVHTAGYNYGRPVDLNGGDGHYVRDPANTKFFPLTQQTEAFEAARSFGLPLSSDIGEEVVLVYPDLFEFDREFEAAIRAVDFAVESLKPIIARFDKQTIECWLDIREALTEFRRTGNRTIIEGLVESEVPQLIECLGNLEPGVVAGLEAGLGDWDGGTISVEFMSRRPSP